MTDWYSDCAPGSNPEEAGLIPASVTKMSDFFWHFFVLARILLLLNKNIHIMHREEIQNLLSNFGFAETLNRTLNGVNITHMMHSCDKTKKLVEYKIDPLGIVNVIWAFDISSSLSMIETIADFESWLNKE